MALEHPPRIAQDPLKGRPDTVSPNSQLKDGLRVTTVPHSLILGASGTFLQ
jgi:hypothetical protein